VNTATFSADQKGASDAYTKLFDAKASIDDRKALIQNSDQIQPLITALLGNPQISMVSSQVKDVKVNGDTADVKFDILLAGQPVATDQTAQAVKVNGKWLVSTKVICQLGSTYGQVPAASLPPACNS
jgi:hypothetical protein